AVLLAAAVLAIGGGVAVAALGSEPAPAHADALCDQMRAQYGANWPCISVPTNTFQPTTNTPAPTTGTNGAGSGGPQVGSNIGPGPGEGNGTPIVTVPGQAGPQPPAGGGNGGSEPTAPNAGGVRPRAPQPVPPGDTTGQTPVVPTTAAPAVTVPGAVTANPEPGTPPHALDSGSKQPDIPLAAWVVAGAAAFAAANPRVRRAASAGGLRSWSLLRRGGSERATVGPSQLVLINDPSSPKSYVFHEDVPPGGHIGVNPDGSATVYDATGKPVSQIAKPWAFDAAGRPQKTWYTVDENGDLVQHVEPAPNALYPILADPLNGGENPITGRSITATPLANGQEAVEGEGAGTAVVGNPDPGYSPYQPTQDSMLPNSQTTVDQGNGTTNVSSTDSSGQMTTTNVSTAQANQMQAQAQADNERAAQSPSAPDGGSDSDDEGLRSLLAPWGEPQDVAPRGPTQGLQPAPGQERSYGDWVQNNLGGQTLDGVNVQAGPDGEPQYVWTQNNPDGSSTEHTATSAHQGPDGQLVYQDGNGQAVSAAGKPAFVDGNGNGWVQGETVNGETYWSGIEDGKNVEFATGRTPDGLFYVRRGGDFYFYDQNGDLVLDDHLDPGQAQERPIGPDVATVVVGAWPALPPGLKAQALNGLQKLGDAETQRALQPGQDRGDGRDILGHWVSGNGPSHNGKLAEQQKIEELRRRYPGLISQQKRASFPAANSRGRYYDALVPNSDGTYTGIEIKSGNARKTANQRNFDDAVSPSNPAKVTLPNGKTVRITRVRDFDA
ncbi:MAG: hypothetical protein INR62_05230, partial [Rhodospirillales bacterium]|nr:hypothetical protein [Acetobacter sp.]